MPTEIKIKQGSTTYEDDATQFCKDIFEEASGHNDKFSQINAENENFYQGKDKMLEDRENDPRVARSALFVHELTPAIDTITAEAVSKVEERRQPLIGRSPFQEVPSEVRSDIDRATMIITQQLRDSGYLTDGFKEQIQASHIWRTPAAVKVGWEMITDGEWEEVEPTFAEFTSALFRNQPLKPKLRYRKFEVQEPFVQLLPPDQFLYEPNIGDFDRDSTYVLHADYMTDAKLLSEAERNDWSLRKVKDTLAEVDAHRKGIGETHREKVAAGQGKSADKGYTANKVLVVENYIRTYDEDGFEVINQAVMVGNRRLVKKSKFDIKDIRLMKFPFALIISNKLPNTLESLSSIDMGKGMQRMYSEAFNSYSDHLTYSMFSPILCNSRTEFNEQPKLTPFAFWYVNDINGVRALIENPGAAPNLPGLMAALAEKIRQLFIAEDLQQGLPGNQHEKATKTRIRFLSAQRKAVPTFKTYGNAVIKIANMFLAMNRQFHPEAHIFIHPMRFDVPSLTAVTDPEQIKQDLLLIYATLKEEPMYQSPNGQRRLRNLIEVLISEFIKQNNADYTLTIEELDHQLKIANEMAQTQLAKQDIQEEIAMKSEANNQNVSQEA